MILKKGQSFDVWGSQEKKKKTAPLQPLSPATPAMPPQKKGRPLKAAPRNISGLKNQKVVTLDSDSDSDSEPVPDLDEQSDSDLDEDEDFGHAGDWAPHAGLKPSECDGYQSDAEIEGFDFTGDNEREWFEGMVKMGQDLGVSDDEADWLPWREKKLEKRKVERKVERKKGMDWWNEGMEERLTTDFAGISKPYATGPVMANKSARSQRRHAKSMHGQKDIRSFWTSLSTSQPASSANSDRSAAPSITTSDVPSPATSIASSSHGLSPAIDFESNPQSPSPPPPQVVPRVRSRSEASLADDDDDVIDGPYGHFGDGANAAGSGDDEGNGSDEEEDECFEALEAGGAEPRAKHEIRDWDKLRDQIKADLEKAKKKKHQASLAEINQMLIIRNFATLRLKGCGRMEASAEIARQWHEGEGAHFARQVRALARHYQLFEHLPPENRGSGGGQSLLTDERVQAAARHYLTNLKSGEVTPARFQRELNANIFPSLCINLDKSISTRTARRWLIKLGWRRTQLKKGVYMDGHERPDVVKYRQEVFLPAMAQYEKYMVQYLGPELTRVEPQLQPGERRIIVLMQDESCMHASEYKSSVW